MLDHSSRFVKTLPGRPSPAQAQVGVLTIQEKRIVEQADLVEHLAAVERRRTAGKQSILAQAVALHRLAMAPLLTAAIARDQHSRGIEQWLAGQSNLGCDHPDLRPFRHRGHQGMKPPWTGHGIVIQSGDKWCAGSPNCLIHRGPKADITVVMNDADPVAWSDQTARAVIDDDDFEIAPGLPRKRVQARLQRVIGGEGRHDYSYRRLLQARLYRRGGKGWRPAVPRDHVGESRSWGRDDCGSADSRRKRLLYLSNVL